MSKVNPKDAPEGYIAVPLPEINPCDACDYIKHCEADDDASEWCKGANREDGENVIFKSETVSCVDPNEAPEGYVAVEAREFCDDCAFAGVKKNCPDIECRERFRADKTNVIFKKKLDGMTFEEALKLLREGKEVRRKWWRCRSLIIGNGRLYFCNFSSHIPGFTLNDLNATDWEEYKEDSK